VVAIACAWASGSTPDNVPHRSVRQLLDEMKPSTISLIEITVLIDCEEDRTLRAVLVGMLREAER